MRVRRDSDNDISIVFKNGSRIVGLPGKEATTRGFSNVSLLLFDEASRVPDDLFRAMRPTLAVSGGLGRAGSLRRLKALSKFSRSP